jgi:competence protein ComEA
LAKLTDSTKPPQFIKASLDSGKTTADTPSLDKKSQTNGQVSGTQVNSGKININSASAQQLDTLPGIGTVRAQKIIDNRPYSTINDLVKKKVLGEGIFEKLKDQISVY